MGLADATAAPVAFTAPRPALRRHGWRATVRLDRVQADAPQARRRVYQPVSLFAADKQDCHIVSERAPREGAHLRDQSIRRYLHR